MGKQTCPTLPVSPKITVMIWLLGFSTIIEEQLLIKNHVRQEFGLMIDYYYY